MDLYPCLSAFGHIFYIEEEKMKKTKRLSVLILALTMVFTIMISTASAAVSRGRACFSCGSEPSITSTKVISRPVTVSGCSFQVGSHKHMLYWDETTVRCPCGKLTESYESPLMIEECLAA